MLTLFLKTHGKQYAANVTKALTETDINFSREFPHSGRRDVVQFLVDSDDLIKAKEAVTDYYLNFKDMEFKTEVEDEDIF